MSNTKIVLQAVNNLYQLKLDHNYGKFIDGAIRMNPHQKLWTSLYINNPSHTNFIPKTCI